jgi:TctA family transporter
VIGVYSTNNNSVLMVFTAGFALLGYILTRLDCEPAPMVLGFILGPLMEENLRRSLVLSRGDPIIFVQRPISAILLVMSAIVVALIVLPAFRKTREEAFVE